MPNLPKILFPIVQACVMKNDLMLFNTKKSREHLEVLGLPRFQI